MIVIGIDPGVTGAIAGVHTITEKLEFVHDAPVVGKIISAHLLAQLEYWRDGEVFGDAVIEDVHSMPKQGVTSSFNFGRSKGVVEGVMAGAGRPLVYTSPSVWKREMLLSRDKDIVRRRAIEKWPEHADWFKLKKYDGRAEAAFLALWHVRRSGLGLHAPADPAPAKRKFMRRVSSPT